MLQTIEPPFSIHYQFQYAEDILFRMPATFKLSVEYLLIMEIMVIDYDDNVNVNIKDTGKEGLFDEIKKQVSDDENLKFTNVLGFNNFEYVINKKSG